MKIADIQKSFVWPVAETDSIHALVHLARDIGRCADSLHEVSHGHALDKDKLAGVLSAIVLDVVRIAQLENIDLSAALEKRVILTRRK